MAKSIGRWEPVGDLAQDPLNGLTDEQRDCVTSFMRDERLALFGNHEAVAVHNGEASDADAWAALVAPDYEPAVGEPHPWGPTANTEWLRGNNLRALR